MIYSGVISKSCTLKETKYIKVEKPTEDIYIKSIYLFVKNKLLQGLVNFKSKIDRRIKKKTSFMRDT